MSVGIGHVNHKNVMYVPGPGSCSSSLGTTDQGPPSSTMVLAPIVSRWGTVGVTAAAGEVP